MVKYILGYDIGSSSVKAALLDIQSGRTVATAFSPSEEMQIVSPEAGFAEQDPDRWWLELINATDLLHERIDFSGKDIASIGISYQMHGLVCVDKNLKPLRSSIIWCDSRAVDIGNKAFDALGRERCLEQLLNSPGNFTASKLKWVKEFQPEIFEKIFKVMLPGDYIAMLMTGMPATTVSGLSEGILWNFRDATVAKELLDFYGIPQNLLCDTVPTFGDQGKLTTAAAEKLSLQAGTPVSYRAGDQPNNAASLNVFNPGEVAATAGTSGVIYGVIDQPNYDPLSRVNNFVHVNHTQDSPRYGVLLCVNGTGSLNSWLRKNLFSGMSYQLMNEEANIAPIGSDGLMFYPFGNGAERILGNLDPGACLKGIDFNRHSRLHIARAAQEGIVFALRYGMEVMEEMGMVIRTIRAGHANMFLSDLFANAFANTTGCTVELYDTDGASGAARAAGVGAGIFSTLEESYQGMQIKKRIDPDPRLQQTYAGMYQQWKNDIDKYTK